MVGTWGISNYQSKASYLAFFPLNLRAIWTVLKGEQIKFPTTPKEREDRTFPELVRPQTAVMVFTLLGIIVSVAFLIAVVAIIQGMNAM